MSLILHTIVIVLHQFVVVLCNYKVILQHSNCLTNVGIFAPLECLRIFVLINFIYNIEVFLFFVMYMWSLNMSIFLAIFFTLQTFLVPETANISVSFSLSQIQIIHLFPQANSYIIYSSNVSVVPGHSGNSRF